MFTEMSSPADYKTALYIRLSKEDNNGSESQSVANQRSMLREFCQKHKLYVHDEYIDDGFSGGNFERPAFNRLVHDIESKKVNMVITKDMSRLGRDYIQTGYYMERYFPENHVRYISLLDGIDTGIDSSLNDITPFKAILNDMYAKDISKKVKSVKHDKRQKGLFIGWKAPYGYMISPSEKNTLIIDEEAAKIVKMIFAMSLSGKSCREIAFELNEQGIVPPAVYANLSTSRKGPYSGLWSTERITYTLKNQMYIGNMVQGTSKKINYKSKKCIKIPKEQWVIVENTHPPIIEKSDFDTVQLLIASRKRTRSRTYDYLLKGLVFCKECGYPLGVINRILSGNKPTLYFVCRTYQRFTKLRQCSCHCIRVEIVTDLIMEQVKGLCRQYVNREELSDIVEILMMESREEDRHESNIRQLSNQINNITSRIDKIYTDKLNDILDDKDFKRFYTKLRNNRATLQNKLNDLQSQDTKNFVSDFNANECIEQFLESANENRELLCSLIEKIEIAADLTIDIYFRFNEPEAI